MWHKVIAVDFDGCLCESKWPDIGVEHWPVINELIRRKSEGDKIILWTCRDGEQLEQAVLWCANRGIRFDAVNENLPEHTEYFGNDCRKVFADEYWDDKAVPMGDSKITAACSTITGKETEKKEPVKKNMLQRLRDLFI